MCLDMRTLALLGMGSTVNRAICAAALLLSSALTAAQAANVNHGRTLATRWCAACHIVSQEQSKGTTDAPPFSEIARRPGFDAAKLALFLLAPHPPMSGLQLSRAEASDLAAYIESQRAK